MGHFAAKQVAARRERAKLAFHARVCFTCVDAKRIIEMNK